MSITSPYIKRGIKPKQQDPLDVALGIRQKLDEFQGHIDSLTSLKESIKNDHLEHKNRLQNEHKAKIGKLDELISQAQYAISTIKKGDKGQDAPTIDEKALEERIASRIKQPKDGETPIIDYSKVAKLASKLVKVPEIKTPEIDHETIAEKVLGLISKGKKLSIKHIGDSEIAMESYLRRYGYKPYVHGGGDTISAGSNITITTTNGVKTISSSGGSATIYTETPSGLVDGANKIYTTVHATNTIIGVWINGQFIHPSDYTKNASGFTMGTALDASLSGFPFTISYT